MRHQHKTDAARRSDAVLNWMMRIVGIIMIVASMFFINRDLSLSPLYGYFFASTALLGLVTVASSWITPRQARTRLQKHRRPQLEAVRERA